MKTLNSLLAVLSLATASTASANVLWDCNVVGGKSSLESASIEITRGGLAGSVMYNRPFDNEGSYDVPVAAKQAQDKLGFYGRRRDGGTFYLVLQLSGKVRPKEHARGVLNGFIPASADTTGFGSEKYSNIPVECVYQGRAAK